MPWHSFLTSSNSWERGKGGPFSPPSGVEKIVQYDKTSNCFLAAASLHLPRFCAEVACYFVHSQCPVAYHFNNSNFSTVICWYRSSCQTFRQFHPIRNVLARLQSSYQLYVHFVHAGVCSSCGIALGEIPSRRPKAFNMPCCKHTVHSWCLTNESLYFMLHRTAPSAVCSLLWGYWALGWGHKGTIWVW